ncbi:MAG: hypothetical protein HYR68_12630, partial [Burkholderiales bacterium]|nr:hypothetical protein [Burkholderiales bacterium]
MKKLKTCLLATVLITVSVSTYAQLLAYDNKEQVYGAAAVSPESGGKLLGRLLTQCSQYGEPVR